MSKRIPVLEHLTNQEYNFFLQVYADHNSSIGLKYRVNYNLEKVVKVKRNRQESCFEVYFRNGEWFKYFLDGTWG